MHLGVIGQSLVGFGDGSGQFGIGAVRTMWPEQCVVMRQGLAVNERLSDVAALGQLGLDPFRVDVAPETGDELVLLAALEIEKTFRVELAQIAARPPLIGVRRVAQITEQCGPLDQHLAVLGQAHFNMRQRSANAAGAACAGAIEAHHRGAFGQAVTFINRQPDSLRTVQQILRDPRTADSGKAQGLRVEGFLFGGADQQQQQLRHQDQTLRRTAGEITEQARNLDAAGALNAEGFLARHTERCAGIQRGIAAEVL
ncbi:hypothetical protein D3C81_1153330 [compost metagenome]